MKKIRELWYAKLLAWILIAASSITFLGSCVGAVVMEGIGVFDCKFEEKQKELLESIREDYSVQAVYNMLYEPSGTNQTYFADKGFQYGIIEAESLDDVNLENTSSYVERNFTGEINDADWNRKQIHVNDKTGAWYKEKRFGSEYHKYEYYWGNASNLERHYADRICYDTKSGIFYYRADGKYYPVKTVEIEYEDQYYQYEFDREKGCYRKDALSDLYEESYAEEEYIDTQIYEVAGEGAFKVIESLPDDKVMEVLGQQELTFNQLDHTGFGYPKWGNLIFDYVRELDASELTYIDTSTMNTADFPEVADSYLDDNYTLNVLTDAGEETSYWVISSFDESIFHNGYEKTGLLQLGIDALNNNINRAPFSNALLIQAYRFRVSVFVIMLISFFIMLGSFVFLMAAAGHRKGSEEIVETFVDRIPFDIASGIVLLVEVVLLVICGSTYASASMQLTIGMVCVVGFCMGCLLLWYFLSISVRIKKKKLIRNTVCYKVLHKIYSILTELFTHVSVLWKTVLAMAIFSLVELVMIGLGIITGDAVIAVFGLFCLKAVVYIMILCKIVLLNQLHVGSQKLADGDLKYQINTAKMTGMIKQHADNLNSIGIGMTKAVDERMRSERMKTELITNVSHDIKTPLTSIINYVDLLQKEELHNEKADGYLEILERQSSKLKKLIEDLVEASKASSGCLPVHLEKIDIGVLLMQAAGEFEDKLKNADLELIMTKPDKAVLTMADGRHLWRVIDNLMNNICKYSQPGSRVYLNLEEDEIQVRMVFRNVSRYQLNITSEELMERFVRGDKSRNTDGHGLGLSIAKSLMELMDGQLKVLIDGDLFKVIVTIQNHVLHSHN